MPEDQKQMSGHLSIGVGSVGQRARALKRRDMARRLLRAGGAALAIWVAALLVGLMVDGIGIEGLIVTFFAMAVAFVTLLIFPRMHVPGAVDLRASDLKGLAAKTELFLEAQRPHLPPPAQDLVDRIGLGLDQLSPQLGMIDEQDGIGREARKLLGEHLPALLDSYTRLPEALRSRDHAGSTPEARLVDGLSIIAREIGEMTEAIAKRELDALATRGRYLESKYAAPEDLDRA